MENVNLDPFLHIVYLYISIHLLTHWGRVMHICVDNLTIIGSDNGLPPGQRQAIIWTSAGILLIGPLGTNFSEILIEILTFSLKKMRLKVSSAKWCLFRLGLNVLITRHLQLYWLRLIADYWLQGPLLLKRLAAQYSLASQEMAYTRNYIIIIKYLTAHPCPRFNVV